MRKLTAIPTAPTWHARVPSPLGDLVLVATKRGLRSVRFADQDDTPTPGPGRADEHPALAAAAQQLEEYFAGRRQCFNLRLDAAGTPFQRAVWEVLATIGFGETRSYRDVAEKLGNPGAMRAVGLANGANPIPVIVPCHRVIGADGTLTGFGGGLERKRWLLEFEGSLEPALV